MISKVRIPPACTLRAKARASRAESSLPPSTVSGSPKQWREAWRPARLLREPDGTRSNPWRGTTEANFSMRTKFSMTLASVVVGAALLGGCNNHKPAAAHFDLTPESNQKYLADNKAQKGVVTTASGLQYRVIHSGSGKKATTPTTV